jgi:hypothetical protein
MPADGAVLAQSLNYVAQGQLPIPTCWADPCPVPWHNVDKDGNAKPCDSPGKTPLVKFKDRTSITAAEVRRWWKR